VLPKDLDTALKVLLEDKAICNYLGDEFIDNFCAIKRVEINTLKDASFEIEREYYLK